MRLTRSAPDGAGIHRLVHGKGFRYRTSTGGAIDKVTRARIDALVIPPAWQQVWICAKESGHIQAVGTDAAGRRQYLYHEQWRTSRDAKKHTRVLTLARRLVSMREAIATDLGGRGFTEQRLLAATLRMLDRGVFRVGGQEYAAQNGSYGATTLLLEHVVPRGDLLAFDYPAKSGVRQQFDLTDGELARLVRSLLRAKPDTGRLLSYRVSGQWHEVHASTVNTRFKDLVGAEYSVKDLRTWHATVFAATYLARRELPSSKTKTRQLIGHTMRAVAGELGNTPAVARRSYVDPGVIEQFGKGRTIARALQRAERCDDGEAVAVIDRAVIKLLTQH